MGTTTKMAIPYPEATGLVKDGWEDMKDIATQVDAKSGLVFISTTSFSAVSSQSINNVFTSNFDHYRIIVGIETSSNTGTQVALRLRASGTDTTTNYASNGWYLQLNGASSGAEGSQTGFLGVGYTSGVNSWSYFIGDVLYPNVARQTGLVGIDMRSDAYGTFRSGIQTGTTQFDGVTIYPANTTPTFTGKVTIYGYNK